MTNDHNQRLSEKKDHMTETIRRNSDRGFISYVGCNRICTEMFAILEGNERCADKRLAIAVL